MSTLDKMTFRKIPFDPANAGHRAIYWQLRTTGKQHSEIRFGLEEPFSSVVNMMQCKIADHYSKPLVLKYDPELGKEFQVVLQLSGARRK